METRRTVVWTSLVVVLVLLAVGGSVGARPSTYEPLATPPAANAPAGPVSTYLQYQGRLTNPATGQGVSDNLYTMVFSLYDVASGGTALWTETKGVPVFGGLFSTALGDNTVLPLSLFNGQALWLGIKVGSDPEAAPRQAILPTAYALGLVSGATINGSAITAGTVADARIASTIARDSEIMPAVLAGDGAGSGLDADLLDGTHASSFVNATVAENRYVNVAGPDTMTGTSTSPMLAVTQNGSGAGVSGYSASGAGVYGNSPSSYGVKGDAGGVEPGVYGSNSGTGSGVYGLSANANGVYGVSNATYGTGVRGESPYVAVWGQATGTTGRWGGYFYSSAPTGYGVMGVAADSTGTNYGVYGSTNSPSGYAGYFSGNVKATGTIEASRVTYSTPRVQYFTIGGEGFVPGSNVDYYNTYGNGGAYIVSGSGAMVAPVHLPHGAVVTEFRVYYYDNSAGDLSVSLELEGFSGGYSVLGNVSSSGTPGYGNGVDTTISSATINNTIYSYLVYAYSTAWDSNLRIKAAVIEYTVSEVP